VTGSKLTTFFT